ncbi:MAG TPA: GNAT family N-acetyltransferase [Kofleriaceae bacterium]|nr:GNAT family N-acetyltransferase [Kofleriaceae bacterium]
MAPLQRIAIRDPAAARPLQVLLERCCEFIQLVEGHPVRPDEAERLLEELAPGRSHDDKHVLGFFEDSPDQLVGMADVTRGYPAAGDWWISLLLFDPTARGRGLGERAVVELHDWFRREGGAASWLIVQVQNPDGLRFWSRMGYTIVDQRVQPLEGGGENRVWRMRAAL